MRRAVLVTAIMLIVILMEPMEQGIIVRANFIAEASATINSPQSYRNKMYTTSSVDISVSMSVLSMLGPPSEGLSYSVDGKPYENLPFSTDNTGDKGPAYDYLGTRTLSLADGYHYLNVHYGYNNHLSLSTIIFLVNATGFQSPKLLLSPLDAIYTENDVPLTYTINDSKYSVSYKLDYYSNYTSITSNTTLSGLSMGQHTINIQAMNGDNLYSEQTTSFTVSPKLLLSPLDTKYATNNVPLTYTVDDPNYLVYYRLDNSDFISLTSNTTLSGLSEGNHTITVKATDRIGTTLYAEQTANFTVDTTMQTLTTNLAIASGILAVISVLAVVIYRKRKASK